MKILEIIKMGAVTNLEKFQRNVKSYFLKISQKFWTFQKNFITILNISGKFQKNFKYFKKISKKFLTF